MLIRKLATKDPETGEVTGSPGWKIIKGPNPEQTFSLRFLNNMTAAGILERTEDSFIFDTVDGPVTFAILQAPGKYCVFDGERIENANTDGKESRAYVAANFGKKKSPDPKHPAGYYTQNGFFCKLIEV